MILRQTVQKSEPVIEPTYVTPSYNNPLSYLLFNFEIVQTETRHKCVANTSQLKPTAPIFAKTLYTPDLPSSAVVLSSRSGVRKPSGQPINPELQNEHREINLKKIHHTKTTEIGRCSAWGENIQNVP